LLLRDGLPVAQYSGGAVEFLEKLLPKEEWEAQTALLRREAPLAVELELNDGDQTAPVSAAATGGGISQ
jgi:hypothetical protein